MARSFNGTSDQIAYGVAVNTLLAATTGTIGVFYKPTGTPASTATSYYEVDGIVADDVNGAIGLYRGVIGGVDKIWAGHYDNSAGASQIGFSYTLDVWVHCGWRHGSGNLYVSKDGVDVGGGVTAGTSTALTATTLVAGRNYNTKFIEGTIAEVGIWNVMLGDAEMAALGQGYSPLLIRPASLTFYSPIIGRDSPSRELTGATTAGGVLTGTAVADHPRMIYGPSSRSLKYPAPAAGGGVFTPYYYRQHIARQG